MYQKSVLDNSLRLLTSNMPHTRSVSVCLLLGIGSRHETDAQAGISHFIEHLCFRGTERRPTATDISVAIEGVGGIINAGTDKEFTIYWCKVAQNHFKLALDVLMDMVLHSKIEPENVERERHIVIEEINMTKDSPSQQVDQIIDEILWPDHPLGRDITGTKQSMAGISRDMIMEYLGTKYLPNNAVAAIAGNISHEEAKSLVEKATIGWASKQPRPIYLPYHENHNPRMKIEKRDTEQMHLSLGLPGIPLLHPQRFTLDLLNVVLGEGMSSRLFTEVRDKMGLAYSIHSYIDHFLDSGSLTVYAGVEPKKLKIAIRAILEQLSRLKDPIPEDEITKAKELTKGRLMLRMEDTHSVAGWLGGQELLTDRVMTVDEVIAKIDAITAAELKKVANELLVGEKLRLAVVGPVKDSDKLENLLKI